MDYANSRVRPVNVQTLTQTVSKLTYQEMELAYRHSALVFKGVNKKARDVIRKGFVLEPDGGDREGRLELNEAARSWMRDVKFKPKSLRALREMFVFGDGFLELGYGDTGRAEAPPSKRLEPAAVYNVDPLSIRPVKDPITGEIKAYWQGKNVRQVPIEQVQRWAKDGTELPRDVAAVLHPDRILHLQVNSLRDHPDGLGIGVIEAAYINILAKLAGDMSAGDILEWYSKGFYVVNVDFATPEELKETKKMLDAAKAARKNYFVGSERSKFEIKSPAVANVKPFYDNFFIEFAAALEMPVMVLLGVQKGTVTGSEVDLVEYYDDIHAFQELLLEAPMLDVMRRVLKRDDFSLVWVPLHVNKQTEADIRFKDAQSTSQLYGARVLSRRESIRFLMTGELPAPETVPDGYSEGPSPPRPSAPPGETKPEPESDEDEEEESFSELTILPLTAEDRAQIAVERALGERILAEQGV